MGASVMKQSILKNLSKNHLPVQGCNSFTTSCSMHWGNIFPHVCFHVVSFCSRKTVLRIKAPYCIQQTIQHSYSHAWKKEKTKKRMKMSLPKLLIPWYPLKEKKGLKIFPIFYDAWIGGLRMKGFGQKLLVVRIRATKITQGSKFARLA